MDTSGSILVAIWSFALFFLIIVSIILPIIALINILKNDFSRNDKLIWVLIVLLLPFVGAILYFILGSKSKIRKNN